MHDETGGDGGSARIEEIDALRGFAITLMIAYHIAFDAWYLGLAQIDIHSMPLVLLQRLIGTLFLFVVGISIWLSEARSREGYARHFRRGLFLAAVAMGITVATWIYPHEGFVTFGIIHFIALATILAPLFLGLGRLNVLLGLILIWAGLAMAGIETDSPHLFWVGLTAPDYTALDYYPLLPWLGVVLIGLFAGQTIYGKGTGILRRPAQNRAWRAVVWAGRHSLLIYLAHQPIIVGAMLFYKAFAG